MMDRRIGLAALDVEKYSKIGTQDLQNNHLDQAVDAFKIAYKRSHELDDGYTERACAFNLGAAYIAFGQPKRGIEILQKAVPPDSRQEGKSNGDLYFNFGLGYEGLGNLEDAARNYTKALDEYKSEVDNIEMEAETLEKLAQIYSQTKNAFAADTYNQLVAVYEKANNPANYLKQMKALYEKANHFHAAGRKEESEAAADDCMKLTEKCGSTSDVGNIMNDLGLVYTQLQKYDKALTCFEHALPMIRSKQVDRRQEAVLLQNLGATYNFLGDYQRAVGFHENAAKLYAELKNRNSQGQCFANLAFAFSQLKDTESAAEAFQHALQAAKDTGDKRTQWQVTEGLGAVAFNNGNIEKAVNQFKQALRILSTCEPNAIAQDRIVGKLTHALTIQANVIGQHHSEVQTGADKRSRKAMKAQIQRETPDIEEKIKPVVADVQGEVGSGKSDKSRFIPVFRHGSLREFKKVAYGLKTPSNSMFQSANFNYAGMEEFSDSEEEDTLTESEDSEVEQKTHQHKGKEHVSLDQVKEKLEQISPAAESASEEETKRKKAVQESSSEEIEEEEVEEESDSEGEQKKDDREAVNEQMRKIIEAPADKKSSSDEDTSDDSEDETEPKQIDKQNKEGTQEFKPVTTEDKGEKAVKKKDSSSESESDDSDSDSPPVPTKSPMPTSSLVRTYETLPKSAESKTPPVTEGKRRTQYADIHFETPNRTTSGKTDPNLRDHPNYFDSDSEEDIKSGEEKEKDLKLGNLNSEDIENKFNSSKDQTLAPISEQYEDNEPLYQSINSDMRSARCTDDDQADTPSFEQGPDFSNYKNLPRGEMDKLMFEKHQQYRQKQAEAPPLPERNDGQKDSKTCAVM